MDVTMGQAVRFTPAAFVAEAVGEAKVNRHILPRVVTGRVVYINAEHRYYVAEYEVNGYRLRESFKL